MYCSFASGGKMLKGRQLYLLRRSKDISRDKLSEVLCISNNEITIYENGIREIPVEIYNKWIEIIK